MSLKFFFCCHKVPVYSSSNSLPYWYRILSCFIKHQMQKETHSFQIISHNNTKQLENFIFKTKLDLQRHMLYREFFTHILYKIIYYYNIHFHIFVSIFIILPQKSAYVFRTYVKNVCKQKH